MWSVASATTSLRLVSDPDAARCAEVSNKPVARAITCMVEFGWPAGRARALVKEVVASSLQRKGSTGNTRNAASHVEEFEGRVFFRTPGVLHSGSLIAVCWPPMARRTPSPGPGNPFAMTPILRSLAPRCWSRWALSQALASRKSLAAAFSSDAVEEHLPEHVLNGGRPRDQECNGANSGEVTLGNARVKRRNIMANAQLACSPDREPNKA